MKEAPDEEEKRSWPKEILVPLEKAFRDARGEIQPLVEMMMRSAMLITSVPGAVRANHYHKTDWHYCYMVTGEIEYLHRPTGETGKPKIVIAKAGALVFTPPMADHAMRFTKDTIWLTLSRNARDQEAYEADVVRIKLI